MTNDLKTNEIRQKMQELRALIAVQHASIKTEVDNLKQTASKAVDFKYQLFSHPVLASMIAGILGFFLIPKKAKKPNGEDSESLKKLLTELRNKLDISAEFEEKSNFQSWKNKAFDFMKGYVAQMVISQAKKRVISYLTNLAMRSNIDNRSPNCDEVENSQYESYPMHPQK